MGEDKAMQKLVEEMVWLMHEGFGEAEKVPSHDYFAVLHDYAEESIALILSAVRDGRLDEELGVVGRDRLIGWGSGAEFEHNLEIELEVGDVVIALRKQGTGKEEEKNGDGSGRPD